MWSQILKGNGINHIKYKKNVEPDPKRKWHKPQ